MLLFSDCNCRLALSVWPCKTNPTVLGSVADPSLSDGEQRLNIDTARGADDPPKPSALERSGSTREA